MGATSGVVASAGALKKEVAEESGIKGDLLNKTSRNDKSARERNFRWGTAYISLKKYLFRRIPYFENLCPFSGKLLRILQY